MNRNEFVAYAREQYQQYKDLPEFATLIDQWQIETALHNEGKMGRSDELSDAGMMVKIKRQLRELVRSLVTFPCELTLTSLCSARRSTTRPR